MRYLYDIEFIDLGASDRYEPQWSNKELTTYGNTLNELLDNASYFFIDQNGGELGDDVADDQDAINYITDWYHMHKCPEHEPKCEIDPMTLAKNYDKDN